MWIEINAAIVVIVFVIIVFASTAILIKFLQQRIRSHFDLWGKSQSWFCL